MKKIGKSILNFVNYDLINYYQVLITRRQIKHKLLSKKDTLSNNDIESVKKYWKGYKKDIKLYWHKWYSSRSGIFDVRYIPEDIFYSEIEPYLNKAEFSKAYSDKSMYSFWFLNAVLPKTIAKNINGIFYDDNFNFITEKQLLETSLAFNKLIIKASVESGGGKNIVVIEETDPEKMKLKLINQLKNFKYDYVIQEFISQHPTLKKMNPSSINTIRMMTLIINNDVEFLSAHIRIGTDNNFYDHNGIVCGIDEDGVTKEEAYQYKVGEVCYKHPQNYPFSKLKIPAFEEMKEIAKKEHAKFGQFRLISWDFAVDVDSNPILVEFNLRFQGLNHHQLTSGPVFGEFTNDILSEIYGQ